MQHLAFPFAGTRFNMFAPSFSRSLGFLLLLDPPPLHVVINSTVWPGKERLRSLAERELLPSRPWPVVGFCLW